MSDLSAIVYISTAVTPFTESQLEALLIEARDLNLEHGISGVLLYGLGNFIQYFEGAEAAMRETYQRIIDSKKHKNLVEIFNKPIASRHFAQWQMGFAQVSQSEVLALSTADWQRLSEVHDGHPTPPGLAMLRSFWFISQQTP